MIPNIYLKNKLVSRVLCAKAMCTQQRSNAVNDDAAIKFDNSN